MILAGNGKVVSCGCIVVFFFVRQNYQIEARKGASIQVIGAVSFVKGNVNMVVAKEQG